MTTGEVELPELQVMYVESESGLAGAPEIGKTFQGMATESERDLSRPSIEFYRSAKEVVLFLPTK